jgi:hypothetical protein
MLNTVPIIKIPEAAKTIKKVTNKNRYVHAELPEKILI